MYAFLSLSLPLHIWDINSRYNLNIKKWDTTELIGIFYIDRIPNDRGLRYNQRFGGPHIHRQEEKASMYMSSEPTIILLSSLNQVPRQAKEKEADSGKTISQPRRVAGAGHLFSCATTTVMMMTIMMIITIMMMIWRMMAMVNAKLKFVRRMRTNDAVRKRAAMLQQARHAVFVMAWLFFKNLMVIECSFSFL